MWHSRVSALALACLVSSGVQAYQVNGTGAVELGLDLGEAEQEYSADGDSPERSGDDTAFRLAGTYYLGPNVGLRVGYTSFGEAEVEQQRLLLATETIESEADAFTFGVVATTPINRSAVELWGELGLAKWDVTVSERLAFVGGGQSSAEIDSDSGISLYAGGGLRFNVTRELGVGLNVLWYMLDPTLAGYDYDLDVQTLSASASFRF